MPPVSARDKELLGMPTVASQMPVEFPNGAQWHSLACECNGCHRELPEEQVRGSIVRHNEHMAALEACGLCHDCQLVTRYIYRLHDDMRITGPRDDGWHTWGGQPPSLLQRVKRAIGW